MLVKTLALTWCLLALTGPHICVAADNEGIQHNGNLYNNLSKSGIYGNSTTHIHEKSIGDLFQWSRSPVHTHLANHRLVFKTEVGHRVSSSLAKYNNVRFTEWKDRDGSRNHQTYNINNRSEESMNTDKSSPGITSFRTEHKNSSRIDLIKADVGSVPDHMLKNSSFDVNVNINLTARDVSSRNGSKDRVMAPRNSTVDADVDRNADNESHNSVGSSHNSLCNVSHPGQTERLDMEFTSTIVDNGMLCFCLL